MLKNMKIGTRLGLSFTLLLLLLLGIGALGYWSTKMISDTTIAMVHGDAHIAENAAEARAHILGLRRYEKDLFLNIGTEDKEAEYLKKWNAEHDELTKEHLVELDKTAVLKTDKDTIKKMKEELSAYDAGFARVYGKVRAGKIKNSQEANAAMAEFKDSMHKMEEAAKELSEEGNKRVDAMEPALKALTGKTVSIMMVIILCAILSSAVMAIFMTKSIADPIKEIAASAQRISMGDLEQEVTARRGDEVGDLADSFREMISYLKTMAKSAEEIADGDLRGNLTPRSERDVLGNAFKKMLFGLRDIINEVRGGAGQMTSASMEIASASEQAARNNESAATAIEETTATMHEMSANIQNVSKSTQSQASSVTETSASIEQMITSIQRIANTSRQMVELSQKTTGAVNVGLEAVEKSMKGTDEISRAIARSADTISVLGSRVEDIGRIVDVIDDLAEQTNLLALNAAIEAARAGEQGLGFAVVAEEVRKLAERSAKSTREIAELITGIQKESQEAVKLMDKSILIVEKGVDLSKQVGNSLRDIESSVVEVDRYSREIGAATQEQSSGSMQIGKASENLREITHEITSATDEQATAAEQIVRTMEKMREMINQNASASVELASSAEQLNSQAERFQQVVGKFVLDGPGHDFAACAKGKTPAKKAGGNGDRRRPSYDELQTEVA